MIYGASPREDGDSALQSSFWRKLGRVFAQIPFAEDLLTVYYCAFDRDTPRHVKVTLFGALAYFVLPTDAIPDMLPVLGFTDDAAVLAAAIKLMIDHITPAHRTAARIKLTELQAQR
ncbi:MAG TPA: YkvA family protein [Pseudolabrys sp.]|nr:YkvA family protein [Pseudolabrys sp.]